MDKIAGDRAESMLRKHGIKVAGHVLARDAGMAAKAARKLGYPVVLKVSSMDILHKSDVGGVVTDLRNEDEVSKAFERIIKSVKRKVPKAKIDGIMVQKMVPGREVIIGAKRDPQFGPVIMFGLGGIFVEVLKDVSFRLVPVTRDDIREMAGELKGYPILKGIRGQKPVNFEALEKCMLSVSRMMEKNSEIQELDLNPVMLNEKEAIVADVRILRT